MVAKHIKKVLGALALKILLHCEAQGFEGVIEFLAHRYHVSERGGKAVS
jgi:hypothetical protein